MAAEPTRPLFTVDDAQRAGDEWGFNCGPAAIAVIAGMTPSELRPSLRDFESKRYTNPTLMWDILRGLDIGWKMRSLPQRLDWPRFGIARVQWEGPWTAPGVPMRVRYRHTHWVASCAIEGEKQNIFDVNCMCVGGWVPLSEWSSNVVPWLLEQCEPKANGCWHLTHSVEVDR